MNWSLPETVGKKRDNLPNPVQPSGTYVPNQRPGYRRSPEKMVQLLSGISVRRPRRSPRKISDQDKTIGVDPATKILVRKVGRLAEAAL